MFENSIFSTFIPQILMVMGYLFCIVNPSFKQKVENEKHLINLTQQLDVELNKEFPSSVCSIEEFQLLSLPDVDYKAVQQYSKYIIEFNFNYDVGFVNNCYIGSSYLRPPPILFLPELL